LAAKFSSHQNNNATAENGCIVKVYLLLFQRHVLEAEGLGPIWLLPRASTSFMIAFYWGNGDFSRLYWMHFLKGQRHCPERLLKRDVIVECKAPLPLFWITSHAIEAPTLV
jgi:hypothetical protein